MPSLPSFLPQLPRLPLPLLLPAPAAVARAAGLLRRSDAGPHPRVVVVTGASSGIGRATALELSSRGDHVVLVARREEVLDEVAEVCRDEGAASALVLPADLDVDEDVAALVDLVLERHGRVDALVHSAGVVAYGRAEELDAETFDAVVRTNLLASANVARHTMRVLRRQERGVLVLVGSLLGHVAVPDMTPYVVSKWGVRALARQLQIESSDLPHVHVCHVSPGSVDTPIYDSALDSAGMVNRPPPPSISPERVGRQLVACLDAPGPRAQTGLTNYALVAAFALAPAVWDRAIGPAFDLLSRRPAGTQD